MLLSMKDVGPLRAAADRRTPGGQAAQTRPCCSTGHTPGHTQRHHTASSRKMFSSADWSGLIRLMSSISPKNSCAYRASTTWPSPPCVPRRRYGAAAAGTEHAEADAAVASVQREAVIIVDHGSRRAESNDMLLQFADLYRAASGRTLVEVAHMEIAPPSIADAIAKCAAAGATDVVIAPYFLSRGRHIQDDIPALVAEAAALHPGLRCTVAAPIGLDPLMAQLIENRVEAATQGLCAAGGQ